MALALGDETVTVPTEAMSQNSTGLSSGPPMTPVLMHPYVEIPFLIIIILIGTVGNLFIIGAALVERSLRNMGLTFVINLAVADLVVTAWYLPQIFANVVSGYINSMEHVWGLCLVTGFMVSWCCEVSVLTLMFIALSRYWKVTRSSSHKKWFGKRQTIAITMFIWIECFLVALPLIVGWKGTGTMIGFDKVIVSCSWNDKLEPQYNIFLIVVAIFIPLIATVYFYVGIFKHVRESRKPHKKGISPVSKPKFDDISNDQVQVNISVAPELSSCTGERNVTNSIRTHHVRHNSLNAHKIARSRRAEERERNLMFTLVVVVVFFVLCWIPYSIVVLLPVEPSPLAKRACGWLALSNSAINSVIYGVLNRHFRAGYVTLAKRICSVACCCFWNPLQQWTTRLSTKQSDRKSSQSNIQEYKQYTVKFG